MYLIILVVLLLDQISKYYIFTYLRPVSSKVIIPNFFKLLYVENRGAAFGIMQNQRFFFLVLTAVVVIALIIYEAKNKSKLTVPARVSLMMIIGGALGNALDRVRLGYVIDFLSFKLFKVYDFAVFNVADCFIVGGCILLVLLVFFERVERK